MEDQEKPRMSRSERVRLQAFKNVMEKKEKEEKEETEEESIRAEAVRRLKVLQLGKKPKD